MGGGKQDREWLRRFVGPQARSYVYNDERKPENRIHRESIIRVWLRNAVRDVTYNYRDGARP